MKESKTTESSKNLGFIQSQSTHAAQNLDTAKEGIENASLVNTEEVQLPAVAFVLPVPDNPRRAVYSEYVKEEVRLRYSSCHSREERQALADELGVASVSKLYNLACRVGSKSTT